MASTEQHLASDPLRLPHGRGTPPHAVQSGICLVSASGHSQLPSGRLAEYASHAPPNSVKRSAHHQYTRKRNLAPSLG